MNFAPSEEQALLQETVRSYTARECSPEHVRRIFDDEVGAAPEVWKALGSLGLHGLLVPEEHGGSGLELIDAALAFEALAEGAIPGPFLGHTLACLALAIAGTPEQKDAWLPRLATGRATATFAAAEDGLRWQPDDWQMRLESGRLTGTKMLVPSPSSADVWIIGTAGGGLALVEAGAAGARTEPFDGVDRTRRLENISLKDTPAQPLAIEAGGRVRDAALVLLAADAFGCATRLLRETVEYVSTREQFDTPLAQFQGIKHQLADLLTALEPARALYWYAAHAFDHLPDESERAAAIGKAHVVDRATDVARESIELHGGIAFTWECFVHLWYKRIMADRALFGGPDVHRERAARLAGW